MQSTKWFLVNSLNMQNCEKSMYSENIYRLPVMVEVFHFKVFEFVKRNIPDFS